MLPGPKPLVSLWTTGALVSAASSWTVWSSPRPRSSPAPRAALGSQASTSPRPVTDQRAAGEGRPLAPRTLLIPSTSSPRQSSRSASVGNLGGYTGGGEGALIYMREA